MQKSAIWWQNMCNPPYPTSTPAVSQSQALLLIAVDSLCMCRVVVVETKYPHHRQAHSRTLCSKISQSGRSPDNNWPIIARESVPSTSCTHIKYSSLQVVADRQMEPRPIQSLPYNLPLQTLWKYLNWHIVTSVSVTAARILRKCSPNSRIAVKCAAHLAWVLKTPKT